MYNRDTGTLGGPHLAKTGPSSCEWSEYRDTIINLYKAQSLKHVMKYMEDRYGFRASKRQYDRKFEVWGVSKNLKAVEKERILNIVAEQHTWATKIEPSHYRKAIRHRNLQKRRTSSTSQPSPKRKTSSILSSGSLSPILSREKSPTQSVVPWLPLTPWTSEPVIYSPFDIDSTDTMPTRVLDAPPHLNNVTSRPSSYDEETWSWIDSNSPYLEDVITSSSSEHEQIGTNSPYSTRSRPIPGFTISSAMPLVPDGSTTINVEKLLKGLYSCVSVLANPNIHAVRQQNCASWPSAGTQFWSEVSNGIYLLKVNSDLACSALNKAGRLVDAALSDAQSFTIRFVREFFLTLSPGNTRINPLVRKLLLELLQSRASALLGVQHQITTISTELLKDGGDQEVSEAGLKCCVDAIIANRGLNDSSGLANEVECAIIRSHRRNGDYELAAAEALSLYRKTSRKLQLRRNNPGATTEELQGYQIQLRGAATEVAHARMAQRGSHYDEAINMSVIALTGKESMFDLKSFDTATWPPPPSMVSEQFQDKAAIHTGEDLAKICHELGFAERAIEWLVPAESLATRLLGPADQETATAHISEKIRDLRIEVADGL